MKPAHQIARRALDRGHTGGIAMGAHVGFDKGAAAESDGVPDRCFEHGGVGDVLVEHEVRRGLTVLAAHDDQPMLGKPGALGEGESFIPVMRDSVAEVGLRARVISRQFKAALSVDQKNEFPPDREEGDGRVRSETALARLGSTLLEGVCAGESVELRLSVAR